MKEKINKILRQLLKEIEELPTIDFENDTCLNKKQIIELINKYIK